MRTRFKTTEPRRIDDTANAQSVFADFVFQTVLSSVGAGGGIAMGLLTAENLMKAFLSTSFLILPFARGNFFFQQVPSSTPLLYCATKQKSLLSSSLCTLLHSWGWVSLHQLMARPHWWSLRNWTSPRPLVCRFGQRNRACSLWIVWWDLWKNSEEGTRSWISPRQPICSNCWNHKNRCQHQTILCRYLNLHCFSPSIFQCLNCYSWEMSTAWKCGHRFHFMTTARKRISGLKLQNKPLKGLDVTSHSN